MVELRTTVEINRNFRLLNNGSKYRRVFLRILYVVIDQLDKLITDREFLIYYKFITLDY